MKNIPDIEPIAMELNGEQWLHPFIHTWFKPCTDSNEGNVGLDEDTYVFLFETETEYLKLMVKSNYITEGFRKFFAEDDWEEKDKNACFKEPYMNMQDVFEMLYICLIEDTWCPRANVDFEIKNSKDYAKFKEQYPSEQFCFTEFGEKVSKMLSQKFKSSMTPDCGMWIDDDGQWGYDS